MLNLFFLVLYAIPIALMGGYQSQSGQDRYVHEVFFKNVKDGVFVDIGAYDGVTFSNSYFFEKDLNWKGICIEPIPEHFATLKQKRNCFCVHGCVTDHNGEAEFLHVAKTDKTEKNYHLDMLSGLQKKYDPRHMERVRKEVSAYNGKLEILNAPCFTLNKLLEEKGFNHVNFLSLDTEGGEFDILKSIDFDKFIIDVITVENNYGENEIPQFLESKGYRIAKTLGADVIFVHRDFHEPKDPSNFVTPDRFDLMAKYIYAQAIDLQLDTLWPKELYTNHIKHWCNYFSAIPAEDLPNYLCAYPYVEKKCADDWLRDFNELILSIKTSGFQPLKSIVPYNVNTNVLMDGGHRVAAALYYNTPVFSRKFNKGGEAITAQQFLSNGMPRKYVDAMAYQYAKLKKNCYVIILFPSARGHEQEVLDVLSSHGTLVYHKNVHLSERGQLNLVKTLYRGESWLGNRSSNYAGAFVKVNNCFPAPFKNQPIRILLFECDSLDGVKAAKSGVRKLFGIGNDSIHINDSHEETIELAQTLFNNNSVHFLNNSTEENFPVYDALIRQYKEALQSSGLNPEYFCIDSSAVMSAYGCRDCGDLDVFHYGDFLPSLKNHPQIESHNNEIRNHVTKRDDIIFNPENHFYHCGLKFASLDIVQKMKIFRNEGKDQRDVLLIKEKLM